MFCLDHLLREILCLTALRLLLICSKQWKVSLQLPPLLVPGRVCFLELSQGTSPLTHCWSIFPVPLCLLYCNLPHLLSSTIIVKSVMQEIYLYLLWGLGRISSLLSLLHQNVYWYLYIVTSWASEFSLQNKLNSSIIFHYF